MSWDFSARAACLMPAQLWETAVSLGNWAAIFVLAPVKPTLWEATRPRHAFVAARRSSDGANTANTASRWPVFRCPAPARSKAHPDWRRAGGRVESRRANRKPLWYNSEVADAARTAPRRKSQASRAAIVPIINKQYACRAN